MSAPLIRAWLLYRRSKGKEDTLRFEERFGNANRVRPDGMLLWIHAVSVGEANSALALIDAMHKSMPDATIMVTTGTVTSAQIMAQRLPQSAFHHYAPVDTPQATERFMAHWQPDAAIFMESELWPNLLKATQQSGAVMLLVNARMSERSHRRWQIMRGVFHTITKGFDAIYASSPQDEIRFKSLGCAAVQYAGNLKFDAAPLAADEVQLSRLSGMIGSRLVWLAASTHDGEELQMLAVHQQISARIPDILTIIIPRHARRGDTIAAQLRAQKITIIQRSKGESIDSNTQIYLADTMNELGLFYRLCDVVWIGGTFADIGGHNPIEPAQLGCALLAGKFRYNFETIMQQMIISGAMIEVGNPQELSMHVAQLIQHSDQREAMKQAAFSVVDKGQGVADNVVAFIESTQVMRH